MRHPDNPMEMQVTSAEDRMWNVRDAILLWLYREMTNGNRRPSQDLERVQEVVGWAADPLTGQDWAQATIYLESENYITGSATFGGGIVRPSITSKGENQAAAGDSVRPGPRVPANPTGVTNNYNITNNAPSQVAIGSSDFTQTLTVGSSEDKLTALADLLEKFAAGGYGNSEEATAIAGEIREAATDPEANRAPLMSFLSRAIGTVGIAAGTEIGQQVTELAVSAIQGLGS